MYLSAFTSLLTGDVPEDVFQYYTIFDPVSGGLQNLSDLTEQAGRLWLIGGTVLTLIFALVCCFYGFRLSRMIMSISGFILGSYLGHAIIAPLLPVEGIIRNLIPLACGLLLGSMAWFIYRLGLCVLAFFLTYSAAQILIPLGDLPKILICVFLGLAAAVMVLSLLRPGIILLTAVFGGSYASAGILSVAKYFDISIPAPFNTVFPLSIGLVAAGIIVQFIVTRND